MRVEANVKFRETEGVVSWERASGGRRTRTRRTRTRLEEKGKGG